MRTPFNPIFEISVDFIDKSLKNITVCQSDITLGRQMVAIKSCLHVKMPNERPLESLG